MSMNKEKLVRKLVSEQDLSPKKMKAIIESCFEIIKDELAKGEPVHIVGFGKFLVKNRKERMGRDPNTGKRMHLKATRTPGFLPSKTLTNAVKCRWVKKRIAH